MDSTDYRFGAYRLDPRTGELFRGDELIHLEPRPTRILVRLVEEAGRMVTRRELRELGWPRLPGAAEQSLNTCIRQIRRALDDDASSPRYVETLRGRGYRFVASVGVDRTPEIVESATDEVVADGVSASPRVPSLRTGRLVTGAPVAAVAAVAVAAVVVLVAFAGARVLSPRDPGVIRIAVERVDVGPGVAHADVLGRSLADEMRVAIAMLAPARMEVLGRASTERMSPSQAGDEAVMLDLGITHRMNLTVGAPEEGVLRVAAQMVDVESGTVRWGGAMDATPQTLGWAAGALAESMARGLGIPPALAPPAAVDLPVEVRRRIMKADHLLETHGDLRVALAALDSVLTVRPTLADAHGLRADVLLRLGNPAEADRAAARALERDPHHARALRTAAGVQMLEGSWTEARASLERALLRAPNDPPTLTALAFLLTVTARFDEAARLLEHALRTDPLSPLLLGDAGLLHLWAGRFERAAEACLETIQLDPDAVWALGCAFDALHRSGRIADAARVGRTILERYGATSPAVSLSSDTEVLARVRRWRVEAWEEAVRNGDPPYYLGVAYADVGRTADALRHLEDAAERPSMAVLSMAVEPRLRALSDRPEFRSTLARLKLPVG